MSLQFLSFTPVFFFGSIIFVCQEAMAYTPCISVSIIISMQGFKEKESVDRHAKENN